MKALNSIKKEMEEVEENYKQKYLQKCQDHEILVEKYLMQEVMMRDKDKNIRDLMIKRKKLEETVKKEYGQEYFEPDRHVSN